MTIHAAKGLEFRQVFLCSLSEGVLPSRKTRTAEAMEEERRLAFVAFTRAQDGLYLSEAEGFNHQGAARYPSCLISTLLPWSFPISPQTISSTRRATRMLLRTDGLRTWRSKRRIPWVRV